MTAVSLSVIEYLQQLPLLLRVLAISSLPAALTVLGSAPILLGARLGEELLDAGMGFSAGIMLVASFTSLLLPSIREGGLWLAIAGFTLGLLTVKGLDLLTPHLHFIKGYEGPRTRRSLRKAWLIALAMIIHNVPEGMAVGAAATYSTTRGVLLALAIGVQDIPEGLAVAIPLAIASGSPTKAFAMGALSGVAEALAALIPPLVVTAIATTLPLIMALAAGAMVYVVVHEVVPDIYGHGHDEPATVGFFAGFVTMLVLDAALR